LGVELGADERRLGRPLRDGLLELLVGLGLRLVGLLLRLLLLLEPVLLQLLQRLGDLLGLLPRLGLGATDGLAETGARERLLAGQPGLRQPEILLEPQPRL